MRSGLFICLAALPLLCAPLSQGQTPQKPQITQAPAAQRPTDQPANTVPSRPPYDPDRDKTRTQSPNTVKTPQQRPLPVPAVPKILRPEEESEPEMPTAPATVPMETPAPPPVKEVPHKPKYTPDQLFTAYEPYGPYGPRAPGLEPNSSAYIPMDSWIYPAMLRLYGMGYVDSAFLAMRPWTRRSVLHMLLRSQDAIAASDNREAQSILDSLLHELQDEQTGDDDDQPWGYGYQTVYTRMMGVGGNTLRDSFHLGQTIVNDYGRPYARGFNNITGFSSRNEHGRFSLYVRGEYQHAPDAAGYSPVLSTFLSQRDEIPYGPPNYPQDTIPAGPIPAQNPFRLVEATASFHLLGHEISGGKTDAWLGPGYGSAMAWSNNAENIYSLRINRVEPLSIPFVSRFLGPVRYDFFVGSLKGHTYPNHPWVHSEMFEFAPTSDFQFGFQRTVIWGGAGHEPVTFHTFLRSFFSIEDTTADEKFSTRDPGARFSAFNFSYRLPFLRRYLTFYTDSETHDDVTPPSAPRRAAYRPGLYLSHIPIHGLERFDLRAEAVNTDFSTSKSSQGGGNYVETIQRQGYTNKGYILGDWIGREAKGGQAWLTYHLSGRDYVELEYLNKKNAKDFISGGTTQNSLKLTVEKHFGDDLEVNGWVQVEQWKAPIYLPGQQRDTTAAVQLTWHPKLRSEPQQ